MDLKFIKNCVIFQLIVCLCASKEIPSYIRLCKRTPQVGQCLVDRIYEIMPHLIKGIPEMDVPPIDPLAFHEIKVDTGNTGSVNMNLELLNGTVSGLRHMKMIDHIMDVDKVTSTLIIQVPEISIEATYKIYGRILLFELNGTGHCSFNASDLSADTTWSGTQFQKRNKQHLRVEKVIFNNVQLKNIKLRLDNLFENNDALTENVNNAINDNIDTLRGELEPIIKETLTEIILGVFNRVYSLFNIDELFPKE